MARRECEPCAEPGCDAPTARGSYCAACGARYYVAPRGRVGGMAAHIESVEAQGPWRMAFFGTNERIDFDTLDDGLRARRAQRRVASVRNGE